MDKTVKDVDYNETMAEIYRDDPVWAKEFLEFLLKEGELDDLRGALNQMSYFAPVGTFDVERAAGELWGARTWAPQQVNELIDITLLQARTGATCKQAS